MICELGSRGSLLWFIVENSTCLADVTHAVFLNEMLLRLETSLPFFLVDTVKLDAAEFLELDRNPLKTFGGVWGWGKIPSLRTSGPQLFLLSCEDLSKPWQEMRLHRWLTLAERFRALGQRGTLAKHFATDSHAIHAIGNALSPVQQQWPAHWCKRPWTARF